MQSVEHGLKNVPSGPASTVPVRAYLPVATAEVILNRHAQGEWTNRLPGERQMSADLQVSRGTLREALHILLQKGLLETRPGRGHRIIGSQAVPKTRSLQKTIRFLSPEPLESRRAFFSLMLDKLNETADARGWKIRRDHGPGYFGPQSGSRLKQLVDDSEEHLWILVHANRKVQDWFLRRNLPVIVSGHTYPGVELPSLDVHHYAAGRHAAGVFLRHGHRFVAMIVSGDPLPGLQEGERGFIEAFTGQSEPDRRVARIVHRGENAGLARGIRKLFMRGDPPTAILVETPNQFITAHSTLAQMRLVVPDDVSLISRLDDPFMQHFVPEPSRYQLDPVLFSRTLAMMISHLIEGQAINPLVREIMPDFIAGKSVSKRTP